MPRALVILPTNSYRTADFVSAAAALGVDLAIASEEDPPLDLGDRFVRIDCSTPNEAAGAIVALADHSPIDAVVAADDAGVVVAALASQKLGLAGNPPAAAAATRDKLALRRLLAAAEVPQPAFAPLEAPFDAPAGLAFPVVVKPRTASASQGVIRADSRVELATAARRTRAIADRLGEEPPLLVETYVEGAEVAVEGLLAHGNLTVLAIFDKPDTPSGPTFEETLFVTPSAQPPEVRSELVRVVETAVAALGLTHGPIHAEARIDGRGRVWLLEVASRSIGGLCGRSLRFGLEGKGLEEQILASALGLPATMTLQPRPSGVFMLPIPFAGTLREVEGIPEATAVPGVTEVDITIPPDTPVAPLPEGSRYLGFVFAVGRTADEVTKSLRVAAALIVPRIEAD